MSVSLVVSNSENALTFRRSDSSHSGVLRISKPYGDIEITSAEKSEEGGTQNLVVAALLGVVRLRLSKYVVVATRAQEVCQIQHHRIYKVDKFEFLPLRERFVKDYYEETYLSLLHQHLSSANLYFSHTWDLTNSYQRQASLVETGTINQPLWKRSDDRFFWNKHIAQDLIDAVSTHPLVGEFILPFLNGYVNVQDVTINGQRAYFGLITRRSRLRAGTRYFRRGIDENGNVANFNETEQLLVIDGSGSNPSSNVYSYVQTRGSVPLYWGEITNLKYKPKLVIGESAVSAAQKHFAQQKQLYGKNYLVNLVNQKGHEFPVKNAYENLVDSLNDSDLVYVYFDFHHECSKMRWHRVQILIDRLLDLGLKEQGWFQSSLVQEKFKIVSNQTSVVRTNCMDCLDRTNVVQSQLAKWVLQKQLVDAGIISASQRWEQQDVKFEFIFRNMWADNADIVSSSYSGTGALKTDFTRLGKRTKIGALQDFRNSAVRYLKNNFSDGPRQDSFDLFLGNHLPYETIEPPFFDARPLSIQAVPYFIYGSLIMIIAATIFPKKDAPWFLNKIFLLFWVVLLIWSFRKLIKDGLQYVSWPKLAPLEFVKEKELIKGGMSKGWVMSLTTVGEQKKPLGAGGLEEGKLE